MKQEYKVESRNTCTSEVQQRTYVQRLELEDAYHGYVESRREQVRLQEELVMTEKALRDTQTRSIHEMGEMKRVQELRVDEFTVQKLRESQMTELQEVTSQIQGLQEGELHECFRIISRDRIELQMYALRSNHHRHLVREFFTLRLHVLQVRF